MLSFEDRIIYIDGISRGLAIAMFFQNPAAILHSECFRKFTAHLPCYGAELLWGWKLMSQKTKHYTFGEHCASLVVDELIIVILIIISSIAPFQQNHYSWRGTL